MASKIKVDQIQTGDGTGTIALQNQLSGMTTASLPALGAAQMPAGSVLQVVRGALTSPVEGTASFDIMNVNITPKQADSDMLISVYVQWSIRNTNGNSGDDWGMVLNRDSSAVLGESQNNYFISGGGVDAADWLGQGSSEYGVNYSSKMDIDTGRSSGTSQINYKLTMYKPQTGSKNIRFQGDGWTGTGQEAKRSNCTIVVQEIAT